MKMLFKNNSGFNITINNTGKSTINDKLYVYLSRYSDIFGTTATIENSIYIKDAKLNIPGVPGLRKSISGLGVNFSITQSIWGDNNPVYCIEDNTFYTDRNAELSHVFGKTYHNYVIDNEFLIPIGCLFSPEFKSTYTGKTYVAKTFSLLLSVYADDGINYDILNLHPSYLNINTYMEFIFNCEI